MDPWYVPSLIPILALSGLLGLLSLSRGRPGLAAWCASLVLWAGSLLLAARPQTRALGNATLLVGFLLPTTFLHASLEDLGRRLRPLVPLFYGLSAAMVALGALPQGLFLQDGGRAAGPLWAPMFLLAAAMSAVPVVLLLREQRRQPRERLRYLLLAGLLCIGGGGLNVLLTMRGLEHPAGLYLVLGALALLAWTVQAQRLPELGRFVEFSLRYSALAALLSAVWLLLAMRLVGPGWSGSAALLLFLVLLAGQPLLQLARGALVRRFFPGQGDVAGLARALAHSEARAEHAERLAELGTLSSAVAHEVRNPLGVISGCVAMLDRQGADPELLGEIRRQVERAAGFADELLDYGRPEPLRLRPVQLEGAASMAVEELRQALGEPFPALRIEGQGEVRGDLTQLVRLLAILVENAVLAEARTVCIRVEGGRVEVEDDGPGVPEGLDLFQPFVSGRGRDARRPGTGLGLTIARSIAERHQGRLELLEPGPLGGARFAMELPLRPPLPGGA